MTIRRCFWAIGFFLFGCTSIQPKYYHLPNIVNEKQRLVSQPLLIVDPVKLARFLNVPNMVYQMSETTYGYAQHHLWLPNLGDQITEYMIHALRRVDDRYWATRISEDASMQASHLRLRFERFDFDRDGMATIQGEWQFLQSGKVMKRDVFLYQMDLAGKGYDMLIVKLSALLDELAEEVSQNIRI